MAWPFASLEIVTATNLNAVTRPVNAVCQVSTSTGNSLVSGSIITVSWETEVLDPRGWFAGGTPTVITPNITGWYRVGVRGSASTDTAATRFNVVVRRNSTDLHGFDIEPSSVSSGVFGVSPLILMNGTSDTLSIRALQAGSVTVTFTGFFDVELVYPT